MLHEVYRACQAAEEQYEAADAGKHTLNFNQTQATMKLTRWRNVFTISQVANSFMRTRIEIVTEILGKDHFSIQTALRTPHLKHIQHHLFVAHLKE